MLDLPFVPFEERQKLPKQPGIYYVVDSDDVIVYIGKTNNLRTRWAYHHRAFQVSKGVYRIFWQLVALEKLSKAERAAVRIYGPMWNDTVVERGPRKVKVWRRGGWEWIIEE